MNKNIIMNKISENYDFIFEIIHDIKAPILSIDCALKNIQKDGILNEIYKINRHNLEYIENLITGYSIQRGKYCPKYELVDILKIIEEELNSIKYLIEEKKLRIIISKDKTSDSFIISDKNILKQIILNLVTNAVKYTNPKDKIEIKLENLNSKLSVCIENKIGHQNTITKSNNLGIDIIKKGIKIIGGKIKISKDKKNFCYNLELNTIH